MNNRLLPHWKARDHGLTDEALTALVRSNVITLETDRTGQVAWSGDWDGALRPLLEPINDNWTTGDKLEGDSGLNPLQLRAKMEKYPECFASVNRYTEGNKPTGTRLRLYRVRLTKERLRKLQEEKDECD